MLETPRRVGATLVAALLIAFHGGTPAAAQPRTIDYEAVRATRVVTALRTAEAIVLDGRLDEEGWKRAEPATDFLQKLPNNGAPASERTEARFLYDDDNLYIGVICFEAEPDKVLIKDLREDFDFGTTDLVQVMIDSLHDRRSGFTFVVNPGGARRDTQVSTNGATNQDWDGVWDAKVSRDTDRWYIEYAIPFKTLRFSPSPRQEWGLNITRRIMHRNEESNWAPVPIRFNGTRADLAGTLRGVENIRQGRNLKVKPFVIGGRTENRVAGPPASDRTLDGGVDVKYSVTPSLTLDGTYRTDFAQVEVDQQQVNLTRFNLFFPEKRDFFLENTGIFAFGAGNTVTSASNLVPFFSRRIGLSASGTPIPIVGGARLSGKVDRYDVGVLSMKTEQLGATPSNDYLVARVKRNLLRTGWVGAIVTDRESPLSHDFNRVYGPDMHFQFFDRLDLDSYILRSETFGKHGRNLARNVVAAWHDDELDMTGTYNAVEANFNPEVGFVRRGNVGEYRADVLWKPQLRRSAAIRNLNFGSTVDYFRGGNGKIETRTQSATTGIQFENNGSINVTVTDTFDRLEAPFVIRAPITIAVGDYWYRRVLASAATATNRRISATASLERGGFWDGDSTVMTTTLTVRPTYHLTVDTNFSRNDVSLPAGAFTANLLGTRVIYGFSPRVFFNAFIQYNADTHQVSSNLRFDFLHHPLSDLYVVYDDRRDTTQGLLVERAVILKLTDLLTF